MRKYARALMLVPIILLSACDNSSGTKRLTRIEKTLQETETRLAKTEQKVKELQNEQMALTQQIHNYDSAIWGSVTETGFQRIDTSVGTVLVSITNVVTYGDGTKLTLQFGNPSSGTIDGVSGKLSFYSETTKASGAQEFNLIKPLRAAAWTTEDVTLPGVKSDQISLLVMSLEAKRIFLYR